MAYKKYVTLSFDDGLEQDKEIIRLLKKYGLQATFNLNAGLYGEKNYVGYLGQIGFMEFDDPSSHRFVKSAKHFRIPKDEVRQVYEGYEIASHAYTHRALPKLSEEELEKELGRDVAELTELFGTQILGHAYPGGIGSDVANAYLKNKGILYARSAFSDGKFTFPKNTIVYKPTCAVKDKKAIALFDKFLAVEPAEEDMLFCAWGHGYEMDYENGTASRKGFEDFFAHIAGRDGVEYVTMKEAFLRV